MRSEDRQEEEEGMPYLPMAAFYPRFIVIGRVDLSNGDNADDNNNDDNDDNDDNNDNDFVRW